MNTAGILLSIVMCILAILVSVVLPERKQALHYKNMYQARIVRQHGMWFLEVYCRAGTWEDWDWDWCRTYYKIKKDGSWKFEDSDYQGYRLAAFSTPEEAETAREKWYEFMRKQGHL